MDGTQGVRVGRQDNKPGRREARQEAGWAPAAAAQPQVRRSCAPTARAAARACRAFACASRAHTHTARANTEPRDGVRGAREGHCQPPDRSSSKLFEALRSSSTPLGGLGHSSELVSGTDGMPDRPRCQRAPHDQNTALKQRVYGSEGRRNQSPRWRGSFRATWHGKVQAARSARLRAERRVGRRPADARGTAGLAPPRGAARARRRGARRPRAEDLRFFFLRWARRRCARRGEAPLCAQPLLST